MPGMFGGGGMSAGDISQLANQEAQLNRTNTFSPIYGGMTWSQGGGGGGSAGIPQTINPWDSSDVAAQKNAYNESLDGGGGGSGGTWTQTQTLSPFQQSIFNAAQGVT